MELDPIPCPILRTLCQEGVLAAPQGQVHCKSLYRSMRRLGLQPFPSLVLVVSGWLAAGQGAGCNLKRLYCSPLDHNADMAILRQHFQPEQLERLLAWSADGKRITLQDLTRAQASRLQEEPGWVGRVLGAIELTALVVVFGEGPDWISTEALTRLYRENRFPLGWRARRVPTPGLFHLIARFFLSVFQKSSHR